MKSERRAILMETLQSELALLQRSAMVLKASFDRCRTASSTESLTEDEAIEFEALCARFARTADMLTQKTLRLIDAAELEEEGSLLDRIHRAERRGLTQTDGTLGDIRDLRIQIAHEYSARDLVRIFSDVLAFTPVLLQIVQNTVSYCSRLNVPPDR